MVTGNNCNREDSWEPESKGTGGIYGQAARPISTGKLNPFLGLHLRPINLVIFEGPSVPFTREGDLILRWASHLDAFSGYPDRT